MTAFTTRTDREHIPQLDGFRGMAILLVLAYHYCSFEIGWIGVDLFFVLSGFLITGKLIETRNKPHYFAGFYFRRLLRIVPLYFLVCLLFFWLIPLMRPAFVTSSWKELIQLQPWYWSFGINIYNSLHGWTSNIGLVHFWSLACEMQFYLLWPFLILFFRNKQSLLPYALWTCVAFALLFRLYGGYVWPLHPIYRYVLLPARLDAFAMGALLYLYSSGQFPKANAFLRNSWWVSIACVAAAIVLIAAGYANWKLGDVHTAGIGYTLNAFCWMGLMATALARTGFFYRIACYPFLRSAGKYSYGIYVFHQPVKFALLNFARGRSENDPMNYLLLLAAFAITVALAVISYEWFEKRFLTFRPFAE